MKVLFIGNQARSTYSCWSVLMQCIQHLGHKVVCCVPHEADKHYIKALQAQGVRVVTYALSRKGLNPLHDTKTIWELYDILRKEKPDRVFTFAIKPVIYGNIAAKLARVSNGVACITGLGFSFEPAPSVFRKLLHFLVVTLYKISLRGTAGVFFQNKSDKEMFLQKGIISKHTSVMVCNGTGVDVEHFTLQKYFPDKPTFLLIARLLEAKGIVDFAHAAKILKQKYPEAHFQILGPREDCCNGKMHGALNFDELQAWERDGYIKYLGETKDVRPFISKASVVVLPSWREGLSCALMEGMSMGRPVIASDVPGCRELVREGQNGFLVPAKDPVALANAMERFILEPQSIARMGLEGRRMALQNFDARNVAEYIMQHMEIV